MINYPPRPQQSVDSSNTYREEHGERFHRVSPVRALDLGEHRVTYLPDGFVQLIPRAWFPETTNEDWRRNAGHLDGQGYLLASVGGLLVEHRGRALLIDSGYGYRRTAAADSYPFLGAEEGGLLPANLAGTGLTPDAIDTIAFTHLHEDHVGWAFAPDLDDRGPFFPSARYVTSSTEWAGWHAAALPPAVRILRDRTFPAKDGEEIFPGVTAWTTPGHTAGHTSYVISSEGRRLVVIGDALHSAVQVERPEWQVFVDSDRETAVETRLRIIRELTEPDTLGFGGHFADVVFGRVLSDGARRSWEPVP